MFALAPFVLYEDEKTIVIKKKESIPQWNSIGMNHNRSLQ